MNVESFRAFCLSLPAVEESFPFDEVTLVFKVLNKIFAITGLEREVLSINLKCDPELAIQLREEYEVVEPGFHMNKKHWNTITVDGSVPDAQLREWILHSYDCVVGGMTRKNRELIEGLRKDLS